MSTLEDEMQLPKNLGPNKPEKKYLSYTNRWTSLFLAEQCAFFIFLLIYFKTGHIQEKIVDDFLFMLAVMVSL